MLYILINIYNNQKLFTIINFTKIYIYIINNFSHLLFSIDVIKDW